VGFLRVGNRNLYISDNQAITQGTDTICVLDFYVFHKIQGQGHGKTIFDKMLRFINTQPYRLAYDCPTQQMIKFLYKHYSLTSYIKQNNNFIVYNEFFKVNENI
jgi:alpha-tubulin N-acetyltransferase 1